MRTARCVISQAIPLNSCYCGGIRNYWESSSYCGEPHESFTHFCINRCIGLGTFAAARISAGGVAVSNQAANGARIQLGGNSNYFEWIAADRTWPLESVLFRPGKISFCMAQMGPLFT